MQNMEHMTTIRMRLSIAQPLHTKKKTHMHNTEAVTWASARSLAHHTQHKCMLHTGSAQSGC